VASQRIGLIGVLEVSLARLGKFYCSLSEMKTASLGGEAVA
jgi:hypothetical protein